MKKLLLTIFVAMFFATLYAPGGRAVLTIIEAEKIIDVNSLSWASIDYWLREYQVKEIDKVKAQIRHETGNLTSRLCLQRNNLFGMHYPYKRQTTAIGKEKNRAAIYRSFRDSIKDYALWQEAYYQGGDYFYFLERHGYAEDRYYIKKIKSCL